MCNVGQRGWQLQVSTDYTVKLSYFDDAAGTSYQEVTTTQALVSNSWSHVTVVFSASNYVDIYINGILAKHETASVLATLNGSNSSVLQIGNRGDGVSTGAGFFAGFIDEPKIYDYSRSAAQVKVDFN